MSCRICHDSAAPLVSACGCKGSVALCHDACVEQWRLTSGAVACELCQQPWSRPLRLRTRLRRLGGPFRRVLVFVSGAVLLLAGIAALEEAALRFIFAVADQTPDAQLSLDELTGLARATGDQTPAEDIAAFVLRVLRLDLAGRGVTREELAAIYGHFSAGAVWRDLWRLWGWL